MSDDESASDSMISERPTIDASHNNFGDSDQERGQRYHAYRHVGFDAAERFHQARIKEHRDHLLNDSDQNGNPGTVIVFERCFSRILDRKKK